MPVAWTLPKDSSIDHQRSRARIKSATDAGHSRSTFPPRQDLQLGRHCTSRCSFISTELSDQASSIHRHLNFRSQSSPPTTPPLNLPSSCRLSVSDRRANKPRPRCCSASLEGKSVPGAAQTPPLRISPVAPPCHSVSGGSSLPYIAIASVCSFAACKAFRRRQKTIDPVNNQTIAIVYQRPAAAIRCGTDTPPSS